MALGFPPPREEARARAAAQRGGSGRREEEEEEGAEEGKLEGEARRRFPGQPSPASQSPSAPRL